MEGSLLTGEERRRLIWRRMEEGKNHIWRMLEKALRNPLLDKEPIANTA